jgi:23S rRNA (adenine2503-C2)-methyltransferase
MTDPAPHVFDLDPEGLAARLARMGMARFRAGQLRRWVYERGVTDPAAMTDFSKADRQRLADGLTFHRWRLAEPQHASDGTRKLLLESAEDEPTRHQTECVMIPAVSRDSGAERRTACISSQVGCPVGCRFCASGLGGLEINLTTGQILEQVWWLNHHARQERRAGSSPSPGHPDADPARFNTITNIVFMGMGEPLDNLDATLGALELLTAPKAVGMSAQRITLSTVGIHPALETFLEASGVNLAISLHSPFPEERKTLMPVEASHPVEATLELLRRRREDKRRKLSMEYTLFAGINDSDAHAQALARLLSGLSLRVNIIPYHPLREAQGILRSPGQKAVATFQQELRSRGIRTFVRRSRGEDIGAACGMLWTGAPGA